jgi:hypothetical protein
MVVTVVEDNRVWLVMWMPFVHSVEVFDGSARLRLLLTSRARMTLTVHLEA